MRTLKSTPNTKLRLLYRQLRSCKQRNETVQKAKSAVDYVLSVGGGVDSTVALHLSLRRPDSELSVAAERQRQAKQRQRKRHKRSGKDELISMSAGFVGQVSQCQSSEMPASVRANGEAGGKHVLVWNQIDLDPEDRQASSKPVQPDCKYPNFRTHIRD